MIASASMTLRRLALSKVVTPKPGGVLIGSVTGTMVKPSLTPYWRVNFHYRNDQPTIGGNTRNLIRLLTTLGKMSVPLYILTGMLVWPTEVGLVRVASYGVLSELYCTRR